MVIHTNGVEMTADLSSLESLVDAAGEAYDKQRAKLATANHAADQAFVLAAEFRGAGMLQGEKAALVVDWKALDTVRRETRTLDSVWKVYEPAIREHQAALEPYREISDAYRLVKSICRILVEEAIEAHIDAREGAQWMDNLASWQEEQQELTTASVH